MKLNICLNLKFKTFKKLINVILYEKKNRKENIDIRRII